MDFYKFDCSTGALSKITTATFKTQTDIAPCMFHDEFAYMFCGDMSDNYYLHSKVLRMNLATGELENIDEVVASPTLTTRSTSQGYGGYLGTIDNTPYFLNGTNNHLISFDKDTCDISYSPILNTIPESSDAIYLSYLRERNAKSSELGGIVSVAQALLDVKNSEWISQVHCQRYVNGSNTGALTYYPYQTNNTHSTRRRLSIVHIGKTMQSIDAMGIYPDAKTVSNGRIRQIIGGSVRRLSDVVDYE
jgi:hypothetical protein